MTIEQLTARGQQIAALFNLKADKRGMYETSWGNKTAAGALTRDGFL